MPTDRQKRIEVLMQSDADEIEAAGYPSTAQAVREALARYREGNAQQAGGQQQSTEQATD
jgi:hypothetical protein